MAFVPIERAAEVRAALLAVVSDPEHGADALGDPRVMASLLHARLPRGSETSLLVTAVDAGIPGTLREVVAQGADVGTAMSRAASSFARQTPYLPEACIWVVNELAIALGLTTDAAALPVLEPSDGERAPTAANGAATSWLRRCTFAGQLHGRPRVQLRIRGGYAGLDTLIAVRGRRVKVTNRSAAVKAYLLARQQAVEVAWLVRELDRHAPRPSYGGDQPVADGMHFFLTYTARGRSASVHVSHGSDSPPEPFWALVRILEEYAR